MNPENDNNSLNKAGMSFLKNKKAVILLLAVLVLLIGTAAFFVFRPRDEIPVSEQETTVTPKPEDGNTEKTIGYDLAKPFELVPEDTDSSGAGADSGFNIILGQYDYTVEQLLGSMTMTPETEFTIQKKTGKNYLLKPSTRLKPNQVYSVAFADEEKGISYSWAFQTRKEFFVTSTLPREQATYVPVNTGIEVTFSYKETGDISKYFEIIPEVKGRFEYHKNTVVFVPLENLSYDTIYTVTVKSGFSTSAGGQFLKEDTVFSFQTVPVPEPKDYGYSCESFDFARNIYNLYPYEAPMLSVRTNLEAGKELEFNVYQYNSGEEFKKDIAVQDSRPFWCVHYNRPKNTDGKEPVLSMNTVLQSDRDDDADRYYGTQYLVMPEPLPEGYYIVSLKLGEMERRTYLQINGMAAYVGAADNKTIALVYDSEQAKPVEGAEIKFDGFSLITRPDGLAVCDDAVFDEERSHTRNYEIIRQGHPVYYATIGGSYYSYYYSDYDYYGYGYNDFSPKGIQDEYWGYLFTDRNLYMPNDTVRIWGMLSGKDGNTAPEKVTVSLSSQNTYNYFGSKGYNIVDEQEVTITGPNTFLADISYENLSDGYYRIEVAGENRILLSKNIRVNKYTKPIYTVKTTLDKQHVEYGEKLELNLETKFFEGTPVNGMNFNYYIDNISQNNKGQLTTDINGRAVLNIDAFTETTSWHPTHAYIHLSNADPEETGVNAYENFTIFPRDTMVEVKSDTDKEDRCTVEIETHKINVDGIRYKEWYRQEEYRGEKTDVNMEVILYETYHTATKTGTYYSFISKKTYPRYSYERHVNEINRFNVQTVDGTGTFDFLKEEKKGYHIQISCADGFGRPIIQTNHLYDAWYNDDQNGNMADSYFLETGKESDEGYDVGEKVNVTLKNHDKICEPEENKKVLYMQFRKGMLDYYLTGETTCAFTFSKAFIPNMGVMAVYFDGKDMKQTSMRSVYYNTQASNLNIEVTPSSAEYRPGDTARFDIAVTDSTGKGRKAEVLLSVVDEAFFAISPQSVNLLQSIYSQSVSLGYRGGSIPYTNVLEDINYYGGAECGEGGDDVSADVRSDFKDTVLFETIMTDSDGHGTFQVKLPDNLTQWRVTYQGLTEDLCAGSGKINVNTRLPYFVNTVFHDVFIAGDKPVIQMRSFGTAVKEGEPVNYQVTVTKNGELWKEYPASAPAGERANVQLEALEEGSYTYTVSGVYGEYSDAVMLPFEVLPGFIEQSLTEYADLTEQIQFPEVKWPAKVFFFNENVKTFWKDLIDLSCSWYDRIDSIVIRKQARALLEEYFQEKWGYTAGEYNTANYQLSNGGIALLPYDSANPVLTAKICSLNDPDFNYDSMKDYFYRTIDSENATSTDIAASYWGLAILREPVMPELDALLNSPDLLLVDKLYIGLAYAYIGDINQASLIFTDIAGDYLEEDDYRAYIDSEEEGYDSDDIQEATSLCALLAHKVNTPQKNKLFEYVSSMYSRDILTGAIRLASIKSNIKTLNMRSAFTYELDGKTETVTLEGRDTYSMVLTADKLLKIRFSNISGSITVATVYTAPIGEMSETDPRISVSRLYTGRNGYSQTTLDPSEYIKVELKVHFEPTAPTGIYMVEDYLPACLRYASGLRWGYSDTREWYPHEISGQKVSFSIYHNNLDRRERIITYFVRAVNTGEYTADNAAVFNLESNVIHYSPRDIITVR